jgi:HSP20 family protein
MIIKRISGWPTWDQRSPFEELERLRREMDRLFEGLTGGLLKEPTAGVFPLANITEDEEAYYVRAELPGVKGEDLNISVTGNNLSIEGERKIPPEHESGHFHRKEREAGKFRRVLSLALPVDASKVEAHSQDGVLTITLPKAEAAKPKQITIKTDKAD